MTQNNDEALIAKKELLEDLIKRMKGVYSEYHKEIVYDELTDTLESINNLTPISQNEQQEENVWEYFDEAYNKAHKSSLAEDWFQAALLAQQVRNILHTSPPKQIPDGWKPIETVPKDGTQVIIKCSGGRVATAFYDDKPFVGEGWHVVVPFLGGFGSGTDTFIYFPEDMPTHWMPLPSAPTNTEVGE